MKNFLFAFQAQTDWLFYHLFFQEPCFPRLQTSVLVSILQVRDLLQIYTYNKFVFYYSLFDCL